MAGAAIVMAAAMLLTGSEWGPAGSGDVFVQFRDGRVSGSGGCNRFGGSYEQTGQNLRIGPLMATRMACADPEKMQTEQKFFELLEAVHGFEATHMKLILKDTAGNELGVLIRRDWD